MKKLLITIFFLSHHIAMMAQIIPDLLIDARQDGQKIFKAYMSPLLNRTGVGLNRNWYSTAKPKDILKFDISVKFSTVSANEGSRTYNLNQLDLQVLKPISSSNGIASTIMGNTINNPILEVWKKDSQYSIFNPVLNRYETISDPARAILDVNKLGLPKGSTSRWVNGNMTAVVPFLQINTGIPYHTEFSLRLSPPISTENITYSVLGAGIKHDLMQWLLTDFSGNTVDKKRTFDLSLILGYTMVKGNYENPGITIGVQELSVRPDTYISSQHVTTKFKAFNSELIFSKTFLNSITPFLSTGYGRSKSQVDILGKYPVAGLFVTSLTPETIQNLNNAKILIEGNRYIYYDPISFSTTQHDVYFSYGIQAEIAKAINLSGSGSVGRFNSYSISISLLTDQLF